MNKKNLFHISLAILISAMTIILPAQKASAQDTCTGPAGEAIACPESSDDANPEPAAEDTFRFRGESDDYLDPVNWNHGGTIPGSGENSRLDGLTAVIDPGDPAPIPLGSLFVRNNAHLIINDAVLQFDTIDLGDCAVEARKIHTQSRAREFFQSRYILKAYSIHGSYVQTQTFLVTSSCETVLETTFLQADRFIISDPDAITGFSLGGADPSSPDGFSAGNYSRIQSGAVDLDGQLQLFSIYGFHPDPGQNFELISITGGLPANGTFANAPEGAIIDGFCDVQLRITYQGGDGNDVVLTAEERTDPDPKCEEDFTDPTPEKNIFLDGSMVDVQPNQPIDGHNIQLINGAEADFHDGFLQAEILDISDSTFKLFNSHLKTNIFIYTGSNTKPDGPGTGGPWNNPSFLEAERIVITGSGATIHLGLGGDQPAGENALGKGHYARMQGDDIHIDGLLDIFFVYDFVPQIGQVFEIITANRSIKGEFNNAPEGSVITGYCDVALSISYTGGDGNDVVITAEKASDPDPNWTCDTLSEPVVIQPEPSQEPVSSDGVNAESASTEKAGNSSLFLAIGVVAVLLLLVVFLLRKRPSG